MAIERLGEGPWAAVEVIGPEDSFIGESPFAGIPHDIDTGRCACCNAKLTWRVIIESPSGGKHVVGMTCARRAGGDVLDLATKQEKAEDAMFVSRLKDPGFKAWAEAKPHPKGWDGGLYRDLVYLSKGSWNGHTKKRKLKPLNEAWEDYYREATGKAPKIRKPGKRELARIAVFDEYPAAMAALEARAEALGVATREGRTEPAAYGAATNERLRVGEGEYDFDWMDMVLNEAQRVDSKLHKAARGLRGNPPFKPPFVSFSGEAGDETQGRLAIAYARGRTPDFDLGARTREAAEAAATDKKNTKHEGELNCAAARAGVDRNLVYRAYRAAYMRARKGKAS